MMGVVLATFLDSSLVDSISNSFAPPGSPAFSKQPMACAMGCILAPASRLSIYGHGYGEGGVAGMPGTTVSGVPGESGVAGVPGMIVSGVPGVPGV